MTREEFIRKAALPLLGNVPEDFDGQDRVELAARVLDAVGAWETREALESGLCYIIGEGSVEEADTAHEALKIADPTRGDY